MRVRYLTMKQIGEYFNRKHLLRPVAKSTVENYANLMKGGTEFPAIVCATYPIEKGRARLIVDGNHIFKACQEAKVAKHQVEFVSFESLGDALADQLKRNLKHGLQLSMAKRDERIQELIADHKWTVRRVADEIGIHYASVSRINRGLQNRSKTGKPGAKVGERAKAANVVPHALPARAFLRSVQNIALTLTKAEAKQQVLAEIYSNKRKPQDIQKLIGLLQSVAQYLGDLVSAPVQPVQQVTRKRGRPALTAASLQVAA
jgi:ParB-like chromosome segregation protein Spo0J